MGVNTKSFDNASDMITFSRASGGYGLTKVSYGPELVTNGDFATDSDWTKGTGWSISGGVATHSGVTASNLTQTPFTVGKVYQISWEQSGGQFVAVYGEALTSLLSNSTTDGSYTVVFAPTTSDRLDFRTAADGVTLDNVSVREVTYNSSAADATLQLIYHPNDVPRIEYALDGTSKGLLAEESRTNLVTYSERFSTWTTFNSDNFTVNYAQAPDGAQTATRFNPEFATDPGISAATRRIYQNINSTAGDVVTFSLFVKPVQSSSLYVNNPDGSDVDQDLLVAFSADQSSGASFWNLKTKTWDLIDSNHAAFQEAYPDGWYRIGITYTVANNDANNHHFISFANRTSQPSFDPYPSGEEDAYIWGAQVEAGAFPTSYIKTTGATATRSIDFPIEVSWDNFGYNKRSGTFVVEFDYTDPSNADANYLLSGGGSSRFFYNNAGTDAWNVYDGLGMTVSGVPKDGTPLKVSVAMSDSGTTVHVDGTLASANSSITPQDAISYDALAVGGISSTTQLNGHIKSIKYYPRRLTNAQLQELTT